MKQFGIGQPVRRVEDRRFITGHGNYLDDINRPRQAYAFMLRSPHAHARIARRSIQPPPLATPRACSPSLPEKTWPVTGSARSLASARSPIATARHRCCRRIRRSRATGCGMSATRSRWLWRRAAAVARDAAELIAVDYEPLPAVGRHRARPRSGPAAGVGRGTGQSLLSTGRSATGPRSSVRSRRHAIASVSISSTTGSSSIRWSRAAPSANTIRVRIPTPCGARPRARISFATCWPVSVFKIPENRIRVVTRDVGGGFGMKFFLYPEHVLVLWAAKKVGRPVKWTPERSDAFMTDTQGRDNVTRLELALDDELRFLALDVEILANMGAYLSNFAPEIPTVSGAVMHSGVYAIPAIHVGVKGVFTNTVPVDAYRGAGRPEAAYAVERLIDYAARRLGVPPRGAAPAQFHQARGDAVPDAARPQLRQRRVRPQHGPGAGRRRSRRLSGAARRGAGARPLPRARPRGLYRAVGLPARRVRRVALRPERHPDDPDGDAVVGAGASDRLYPARRRAARRRTRKSPRPAGRHRGHFVWPRHRRLALAAGRRRLARAGRRQADRQGPPHRRTPLRGGRGGCRIRRRRLHGQRDRSPARHRGGGARRLQSGAAGAGGRARL